MFSRALPRLITPVCSSITRAIPKHTRTAVTSMSMSMSGQDIISLIKQDHAKVNSLYEEYKSTNDINMKKTIAHSMIKEIVVHAGSEEVVLYPVVKELLGVELRDHAIEEHSAVERGLYELENNLKVGDAEFDRVLAQTMKDFNHHVQEEETILLPKCASKMDQERLMKLGSEFLATKKHAPHRPHPMAPKTGMAGKIAKATAKPMDDMTDPLDSKQ